MKIGVTGGAGFIGSHLIERLIRSGHEIRCLILPRQRCPWLKDYALEFVEGNILDEKSLAGFVTGLDVIVHLAGLTRARFDHEYFTVNAQGTLNLLHSIRAHNPVLSQFIAMSSQAAVGPSPDHVYISEDHPMNPMTPYGKSKAEVERTLTEGTVAVPYTIVRAPSVFGPRDFDFVSVFKMVQMGFKLVLGKKNKLSFVYVKNLVEGISLMIGNPKALNQIFFISDDKALTWLEFNNFIEKAAGVRAHSLYIPEFVVSFASRYSSLKARLLKEPVLISKHKIEEMRQPYWMISNEKAKKELGYTPLYSTEEGIRESIPWYFNQRWV